MITIQPNKLDAKLLRLAQSYIEGTSIVDIATEFNLTTDEVLNYINSKPVAKYITASLMNSGYANPKKRIELLNKIIDQKIDLAEDNDLPLTKKDLVDVLKMLQDEQKLNAPQDSGDGSNSVNAYIQLIKELK